MTCGSRIYTSKTMPIMINHEKDFKRRIGYQYRYGYHYGYVRIIGNLLIGDKLFMDFTLYKTNLSDTVRIVFDFNLNELILNTYADNGKY